MFVKHELVDFDGGLLSVILLGCFERITELFEFVLSFAVCFQSVLKHLLTDRRELLLIRVNVKTHNICPYIAYLNTVSYILTLAVVKLLKVNGGTLHFLPSLSLHFHPPPSPYLPSLLEVGPLNPAKGLGSAVSSPSGVWGGTPAEIEFGACKH